MSMGKVIKGGYEIFYLLREKKKKKTTHFISVKEELRLYAVGGNEGQDFKRMGFKME